MEALQHQPAVPQAHSSATPPSQLDAPGLSGERRNVTVMFADISGFTPLSEKLDPEQVRDLMNACFEQLVPVVTTHGGTVEKFLGDAIMALFGAPVAHENDPERAVRAALAMMDAFGSFNAACGTDLGIHFGINTGLVVAGGVGTAEYQNYSVMGDTANLASRLEDLSKRGEILVGPDTYHAVSHLFDFQPLGPVRIKGKAEPVPVYKVLGVRARPASSSRLEARGISSPLVGREAEIAAFTGCIERVLAGQGGLVSVTGEAGLGKSRLVAEVRRHTADRELLWLEGRALSFSQSISYWPFLEIIKSAAGITEEDSEVESWNKLETRVAALCPGEVPEILPYLATLLALDVKEELAQRVRSLDGEAMGHQIFRTARRFFARLAQSRPLVVVFEDIHWADHSSTELLEHVLPLVREVPLLICLVGRPDAEVPAARLRECVVRDFSDCHTAITLAPLSPDNSARLLQNLLEAESLAPRVRELVCQRAEGNPFFVEEVIRALIDMGAIRRDRATGRWQLSLDVDQIAIPDTLQGVIMARIDRLEDEVKQVLKMAAVIGRSFFFRLLRAIGEVDRALDRDLAELQRLELIREKSRAPELEYFFKHALVQEAAYESLLRQQRRELHRRIGEGIEALFAERLEEFHGVLAYHYARAEMWEKAQDYLFKAGDQAGRLAADAEALAHYREAIAAYARAFGDSWDPFQRAVLQRKIGEALFRRGEHEQAREHLQRALALLGIPLPTSRWGVRLGIARQGLRQVAHRVLPGQFLRHPAGQSDLVSEEGAHLIHLMAWVDIVSDQERFFLDSLTTINYAEQSGFGPGVVRGSAGLGLICDAVSLHRLAGHYHRRAVAVAEQEQKLADIGIAYHCLALHEHHALARSEMALEHYRRSSSAFWEVGDLHDWGAATLGTALLLDCRGDLARCLEASQEVARIGQEAADRQVWAWGLWLGGRTLRQTGSLDEAAQKLETAVELLEAVPDYLIAAAASGDLGRCYLRQGKLPEGLSVLEAADRLIAERGLRLFPLTAPRIGLAEAYLAAAGRATGAERTVALRKAKRACRLARRQCGTDRYAAPGAFRVQGTYEWLRGQPRSAEQWWQRGLAAAEGLGARYELGLSHLEIGRRLQHREHLEHAEAIFGDIGARLDLACAQQLLAASSTGRTA